MLPDRPLSDGVVTLRPWHPEEAGWYVAQTADAEIQRFTGEPPDLDEGAVREAIASMLATGTHAGLVITDAGTGDLLGNAGLAPGPEPGVGAISYWVASHARGRGTATRAIRLLVDWAGHLGLQRVELYTHVDNAPSQRAAEKAGFRRGRVEQATRENGRSWDIVWYQLTIHQSTRQYQLTPDTPASG